MPETGGQNIEIAHHLHEKEHGKAHASSPFHQSLELIEAIILALVAVTTAWSGYQAARWDAEQALLYGRSLRLRVEGQSLDVQSNQVKQYDAATVVDWLQAEARGDSRLADFFERRLMPEFQPAFQAWKKTDPLHNLNAPSGPMLMPEYRDPRGEEAARKNKEANELFDEGTQARETADQYVRVTVGLATVLFLTAMSQRFKSQRIRVMVVAIAFALLCFPLWRVLTLPRA
jgi:heme/copper-type cytochrome/quinol oxidase subunit 4